MIHEARVFGMTSQMKQYRFIQCHIFGIFPLKCCHMHNILYSPFGITTCAKPKRFGLGSQNRLEKSKIKSIKLFLSS